MKLATERIGHDYQTKRHATSIISRIYPILRNFLHNRNHSSLFP